MENESPLPRPNANPPRPLAGPVGYDGLCESDAGPVGAPVMLSLTLVSCAEPRGPLGGALGSSSLARLVCLDSSSLCLAGGITSSSLVLGVNLDPSSLRRDWLLDSSSLKRGGTRESSSL